jgi:aminoglycoside phosphotransferase (APT) family kinase protein
MLDILSVGGYLRRRGLLADLLPDDTLVVTPLGGGVSSVVLLVELAGQRLVVKQPRAQLLVSDEWFANPERVLIEATALKLMSRSTPDAVPELLDVDRDELAITMVAAPVGCRPWKDLLLAGAVDASVGSRLGRLLGTWHQLSASELRDLSDLGGIEGFKELRIDPYHRTVAARHPDLASGIESAIEALLNAEPRPAFVHGDFSPKNILLGPDDLFVIDFEVAHVGNPVFDVAFLISHLMLKSIRLPALSALYRECAAHFLTAYSHAAPDLAPVEDELGLQVGCLLLARTEGKSPVEYLESPGRARAFALGAHLVTRRVDPLSAWPMSEEAVAP